MATHHGCLGQPLDRDIDVTREAHEATDTDIEGRQDFHLVETDCLENSEHNNPARLTAITRKLDELCQQVQAEEGQPSEALNHIERELQGLSVSFNPPAHTEPLGEVIKLYTNTLCSAQKQTNLTNSLLQDMLVLNGQDATQLEDCLVDIETAADLTAESRTKLAQAKSKSFSIYLKSQKLSHQVNLGTISKMYYD